MIRSSFRFCTLPWQLLLMVLTSTSATGVRADDSGVADPDRSRVSVRAAGYGRGVIYYDMTVIPRTRQGTLLGPGQMVRAACKGSVKEFTDNDNGTYGATLALTMGGSIEADRESVDEESEAPVFTVTVNGDTIAQIEPPPLSKWAIQVNAGFALPMAFDSDYGAGFHGRLSVPYFLLPFVTLAGSLGINTAHHRESDSTENTKLWLQFTADVKANSPPARIYNNRVSLYFLGGAGAYVIAQNAVGWRVGAGLTNQVHRLIRLEVGGEYQQSFGGRGLPFVGQAGVCIRI